MAQKFGNNPIEEPQRPTDPTVHPASTERGQLIGVNFEMPATAFNHEDRNFELYAPASPDGVGEEIVT